MNAIYNKVGFGGRQTKCFHDFFLNHKGHVPMEWHGDALIDVYQDVPCRGSKLYTLLRRMTTNIGNIFKGMTRNDSACPVILLSPSPSIFIIIIIINTKNIIITIIDIIVAITINTSRRIISAIWGTYRYLKQITIIHFSSTYLFK